MVASAGSTLLGLIIIGAAIVFGFVYLTGRVFGAGVRKGGDLWRSGQHQANQRYADRSSPTRVDEGPSEPAPPSALAGWYKDPWGVGSRYWNGRSWTREIK